MLQAALVGQCVVRMSVVGEKYSESFSESMGIRRKDGKLPVRNWKVTVREE